MNAKIKRVLMTTDTIGGVWVFAMELIRELEKQNIEVILATMGKEVNSDQFKQIRKMNNIILEESSFKLEWMQDPWSDIDKAGDWLLNLERKYAPDLIHLNEYSYGSIAWSSPVILTAHSCVYSWFSEVKGILPDNYWSTYREKVTSALQSAQLVIAPTKTMMDYLNKFYGSFNLKKVINNGRSSKVFHTSAKKPYIFSAGRLWDEAKNIRLVAEVSQSLTWPVYVAGDYKNPDKEEIYFDNVRWLGIITESMMAEMLSHASIYALPAKYEPFGLSILEAALSECALILGSIDSLLEIWEGCALFVDPNDPEELSAAIKDLIEDEDYRKQLAGLAKIRSKNYSSGRMGKEYIKVYEQIKQLKSQTI